MIFYAIQTAIVVLLGIESTQIDFTGRTWFLYGAVFGQWLSDTFDRFSKSNASR